jgi:hypothetical protein
MMRILNERAFKQYGYLPKKLNQDNLINLRNMLEVCALEYFRIGSSLQSVKDNLAVDIALDEPLADSVRDDVVHSIGRLLASAKELNLAVCVGIAERFFRRYRSSAPTYRQVKEDVNCLDMAFSVELETRRFFFVPPERAGYYCVDTILPGLDDALGEKMEPFTSVIKSFPSAEDDIREAGNCFALDRPTASVFHLMRVLEAGLKVTAKALSVTYKTDWGQCFRDIEKQGDQSDQFFKEAIAFLRSIKNVWRNPTMHIERMYSEQEAERILRAVQTFMAHLATKLAE